jgi:hypothetical protein
MELPAATATRIMILIAVVDTHRTDHTDIRLPHTGHMDMRPPHMGPPMGLRTLSLSAPDASAPTTRRARLISRTTASGFNVRSEPEKLFRQTMELLSRFCSHAVRAA